MQNITMSFLRYTLATVLFLLFAGILALIIYFYKSKSEQKFKIVEAEIVSIDIKVRTERKIVDGRTVKYDYYTPSLCFKYTADAKENQSCRYEFDNREYEKEDAENIINSYQIGQKVQAYVDPANPTVAYMHSAVSFPWIPVIIVFIFMIVAPLIAIYGQPVTYQPAPYYDPYRSYQRPPPLFSLF